MPKSIGPTTEKLLRLAVGESCAVRLPRVDFTVARKHAPERKWSSTATDGGRVVTRVR